MSKTIIINKSSKVNETDNKLDNLVKYKTSEVEGKIKEIKGNNESQWKALIEVPTKDCKVM